MAEQDGVIELTSDGRLMLELRVPGEVGAVAVDRESERLWVATRDAVHAYTFGGARELSLPVELPALPADVAVHPSDGALWVCAGRELLSVGSAGTIFHRLALPSRCLGVATGTSSSAVWVATEEGVSTLDHASAAELGFEPAPGGVTALSAAGPEAGGGVWLASRAALVELDEEGDQRRSLGWKGAPPRRLAPDGTGGLWVAAGGELLRLEPDGDVAARVQPFPASDGGEPAPVEHLVADPATDSAWVSDGVSLARVSASGEVEQAFGFEPPARIRDLALYSVPPDDEDDESSEAPRALPAVEPPAPLDGDPPVVAVLEPTEGATVASDRPALRFSYSDAGSGVDTTTLEALIDGSPAELECQMGAVEALCAAADALAAGPVELSATIRDLEGNVSAPAVRQFTVVAAPPATTTVRGVTRFEDGSVAGATRVWEHGDPGRYAVSDGDGLFELAGVPVSGGLRLALNARRTEAGVPSLGFVDGIEPVVDGVTEVGVIELRRQCDQFVTGAPFAGERSTLAGAVSALVVHDDGFGSRAFAGGSFNWGGSGSLGRVAGWSAHGWETVGGGVSAQGQPHVGALAVYDDGGGPALYAGGDFVTAGGWGAYRLARWDGDRWQEVGRGLNDEVSGLAVYDDGTGPALYVSGRFTRVQFRRDWQNFDVSLPIGAVARWDGETWSAAGTGLPNGSLWKLAVLEDGSGPRLYAWDSSSIWRMGAAGWESVPSPGSGIVSLVAADDGSGPALFAAGGLTFGGFVKKLVGGSWTTLTSAAATSLAAFDDGAGSVLYAHGSFADLPDSPGTPHLRSWSGTGWSPPLGEGGSLFVVEPTGSQPLLVRASPFSRWDGSGWVPYGAGVDTEGGVTSVAFAEGPSGTMVLFAGPQRAEGVVLDGGIGRWDGVAVSAAGSGLVGGGSRVVQVHDGVRDRVYGLAESAGEVAEWNGSGWTAIGAPIGVSIRDVDWIEVGGSGRRLYAAGDGVYRWNGAFWHPVGGPPGVETIEGFDGALYAGGAFEEQTGVSGENLARWDGSSWSGVGPVAPFGVDGAVHSLKVSNGALHVGGEFNEVAGVTGWRVGFVAWDGSQWVRGEGSPCGYVRNRFLSPSSSQPVLFGRIHALADFDDGTGGKLLIGGDYAAQCISQSGTSLQGQVLPWTNLNLGTGADGPPVRALAAGRWTGAPAVAIGGDFGAVDGVPAGGLALWHAAPAWGSCSPQADPPKITMTEPPGAVTNQAVVTLAGRLDEPAALRLDGAPVPLATDWSFTIPGVVLREGSNPFFFEATGWRGRSSSLLFEVIRDTSAPEVTVVAPPAGSAVFGPELVVDLSLFDSLSGIDPGTLQVQLDGVVQPLSSCAVREDRARCRFSAGAGPVTVRATVRDRAGNLSAPAEQTFANDPAGTTTTQLTGTVVVGGGAAAGARIRVLGRANVDGVSLVDGSFSIPFTGVTTDAPWTVVAELGQGGSVLVGVATDVVPVPGGTTDAGVIELQAGCAPEFAVGLFGVVGVSGPVRTFAVYDDGSGLAVYLGGQGLQGGGTQPASVVRWDGESLQPVPGSPLGEVYALAGYDDGVGARLYAGGNFSSAGGAPAAGLARWDGAAWSEVGGGVWGRTHDWQTGCTTFRGTVYALEVFDDGGGPALYAGGYFERAGGPSGVSADRVARWDGTGWSAPAPAREECVYNTVRVFALEVYDDGGGPALYAGGSFGSLGEVPAQRIARFDGQGWQPLSFGIGGTMVSSLAVYDSGTGPELVAGGLFTQAGNLSSGARNVARWNGHRWATLDEGLEIGFTGDFSVPNGVQALAVHDDGGGPALYALGSFTGTTEDLLGSSIARWDGTGWTAVGGSLAGQTDGGAALFSSGGTLYAGGDFDRAEGRRVNRVSRWDGAAWLPFGTGFDGPVRALAVYDDGTGLALYAGGEFRSFGDRELNHVGRWNGSSFGPVGGGTGGPVHALEVHDDGSGPALYAGGEFATAGGTAARSVARWDGVVWTPLGAGVGSSTGEPGTVYALESHDDGSGPALYAGGDYQQAGGLSTAHVARWRNGEWSGWGVGASAHVATLTTATIGGSSHLFAGGSFTSIDSVAASRVARWDGAGWSALGAGLTGTVEVVRAWGEDRLVAGGAFSDRAAIWDGVAWSTLGGGNPNSTVFVFEPWDDGSGEALYLGGAFTSAGGASSRQKVAAWTGTDWRSLLLGLREGDVFALGGFDGDDGRALWIGGGFSSAAVTTSLSVESSYLARWQRPLDCSDRAPAIAFTSPAPGALVAALRPELALAYSDPAGQIDPASLALTRNGSPLPASCDAGPESATCTPLSDLPEGPVTVSATIENLTGNVSAPASVTFSVETAPPAIAITAPADGAYLDTARPDVAITYSDAASGVDPTTLSLTRAPPYAVECTADENGALCAATADLAEGPVSVSATVADIAGNVSSPASVDFTIDLAPPSLAITAPADGATVLTATPEIRVAYADSGAGIDPATLAVTVDGAPIPCTAGAGEATCTPASALAAGPHAVAASVADHAGKTAQAGSTFTVPSDLEAPEIVLESPDDGLLTAAGSLLFTGSLSEPADLTLDGEPVTVAGDLTFSHGPVQLAQGPNRFLLVATDPVGHTGELAVSVVSDPVPPSISFLDPAPNSYFDPAASPFRLLVGDNGSGIDPASLSMEIDGQPADADCVLCAPIATCTLAEPPVGAVITAGASVVDRAGNGASASVRFPIDPDAESIPPAIELVSPQPGGVVAVATQVLRGRISEPATLTVNGAPVPVDAALEFASDPITLAAGVNHFQLQAVDTWSNVGTLDFTLTLDVDPPPPLVDSLVTVVQESPAVYRVTGAAGAVSPADPGLIVVARNPSQVVSWSFAVSATGGFTGTIVGLPGDQIELTVRDLAGNESPAITRTLAGSLPVPPDPASVAPALDPSVAAGFCSSVEFLWGGADPVQFGIDPAAIDCDRLALVRGIVTDREGAPLSGVRVAVHRRPDLGLTLTRTDGVYDLAVPGGGPVTLAYSKPGHLPARRTADLAWNEWATYPAVTLVELDDQVTTVDLGAAGPVKAARGGIVSDVDGVRQATVLFEQGTTAEAIRSDGTVQPLTTLDVRATEYSVGPLGPESLPAELPPGVAYTYVVELSIDQADALGAARVEFSRDLPLYVEDFLGFPVGQAVPAAYLDHESGRWQASPDGRVVEILAEGTEGAVLDITGDGQPAQPAELDALGVSPAERIELAELYEPGQRLWRVPVGHFTPWAIGWPWLHFPGSLAPEGLPQAGDAADLDKPTVSRFAGLIEVDNQILGQSLALTGTPLALHYRSDRVPGRKAPYVLTIPVTDETPPATLQGVDVAIEIAGQRITQSFSPQASQVYRLDWDGLDRFGRPTGGRVPWTAVVTYRYPGNYAQSDSGNPAWGLFGGIRYQTMPTRDGRRISLETAGQLGNVQALPAYGLGGFSLGIHHVLDVEQGTLYFGDGRRRRLSDGRQQPGVMSRVAGTGTPGDAGDGGMATAAELDTPTGLSMTGDGSLLVADSGNCRIRKIDPEGTITTVAGSECGDFGAPVRDGGPATSARLLRPFKAIEGPDGSIYIADTDNHRIRRVLADGTIETVAGNGELGCDGVGGPARSAQIANPRDLAFDAEGNLLIVNWYVDGSGSTECTGVYRIDGEGRLTRLVDQSHRQCEGVGCIGFLAVPQGIAVGRDGSLYTTELNELTRRPPEGVNPEGEGWNVGGLNRLYVPGEATFDGDGLPASFSDSRFNQPVGVALGRDGSIYVADHLNQRLRQIGPDGILNTVAGGGSSLPTNEVAGTGAVLGGPWGVAVDPSGESVYFTDVTFHQVWKLSTPAIGGSTERFVPSEDGSVLYVFDGEDRHLRTEDSVTREALWTFRYTAYPMAGGGESRLLTEVEDAFGNVVEIERDVDGRPTAVVAPFGQRTELVVNPTTGYLREVRRQLEFGSERVELTIDPNGLLRSIKTPKNQIYGYDFDSEGRLVRVEDPEQGELDIGFQSTVSGHRVTLTTAENRVSSTEVSFLPEREIRQKVTLPTGHEIDVERQRDGSFEWTYPDDTEVVVETGPDPRLGAKSRRVTYRRLETPEDHREHVVEREREVITAGGDPLAVGSLTDRVRVNGRESATTYTASDRTVRSTSPEGRTGEAVFDEYGRLVEARSPGVLPVAVTYDALGRMESVRQGSGQDERVASVTYDAEGYVESVTDPLLRTTSFEYDRVGRVLKTILPDEREVGFEYDLNGNLTKITPPSRPDHKFDHNDIDQVERYEPPDLDPGTPEVPATTYAYDRDHRLTTITRPDGQQVTVQYDSGGRVDAVVAPSHTIDLSYDATTGKLSSVAGPDGTTVAYDYDGPWVEEVTIGGPFNATVQLEPDQPDPGFPATNFWLGKLTLNDDPATEIESEYDDDGLPTRIGEMDLFHDPASGRWLGSHVDQTGVRVTRNAFGELERLEAGYFGPPNSGGGGQPPFVGSSLLDVTFERDKTGRIERRTERTRTEPGGAELTRVYEYGYDEDRGWLEEVKREGVVVESYAYDPNGNRTSWTTEFGSGAATYDDQDRLLTYGGLAFTYTENGELLTKSDGASTVTYGYDVLSNLRTVTLADGIEIEYLVDGRNRRVGKKIDGVLVQRFVYLSGLAPIAELDETGQVTTQYVYGSRVNLPDYFVRGGVIYRVITDHLGSVRAVVDAATGAVAQRMEYDSFGRVTLDTNPGLQPFGFGGGLYDRQTGLVRFGARDYDPELGRWTSKDPIGFAGGSLGLFTYAGNDPINRLDPNGLDDVGIGFEDDFANVDWTAPCKGSAEDCRDLKTLETGITVGLGAALLLPAAAVAVEAAPAITTFLLTRGPTLGPVAVDLLNPNPGDLVPPLTSTMTRAGLELTDGQASNLARFNEKLPKGSTGTAVDELGDGFIFTAEVPGRVPGSKAVYQKLVDADGVTTGFTKTTFDPQGNIIHIKDKLGE